MIVMKIESHSSIWRRLSWSDSSDHGVVVVKRALHQTSIRLREGVSEMSSPALMGGSRRVEFPSSFPSLSSSSSSSPASSWAERSCYSFHQSVRINRLDSWVIGLSDRKHQNYHERVGDWGNASQEGFFFVSYAANPIVYSTFLRSAFWCAFWTRSGNVVGSIVF